MKIIIGSVGYLSAGKETFYGAISPDRSIPRIIIGDIVRAEVKRQGLEVNVENMEYVSELLRQQTGNRIMRIAEGEIRKQFKTADLLFIDSIRDPQDRQTLLEYADSVKTLAICASAEIRYARMLNRGREGDPKTLEEFVKKSETREKCVGDLITSADYTIENEATVESFTQEAQVLWKIIMGDLKK